MTHLLDTNSISYAFRGEGGVAAHLASMLPTQIGIPAPVLYESFASIGRLQPGTRRAALEAALRNLAHATQVIPFDKVAAEYAAKIRAGLEARGALIGPIDVQIAGIALAIQATLVTRNTAEFSRLDGLSIVDWYAA